MSRTRQPTILPSQSTTDTSRESSTLRLTATLRLRAEETPDTTAEPSPSRRIRWSENVVDNEGMGKKSSKGTSSLLLTGSRPAKRACWLKSKLPPVCCIYHKARPVGESSSEESSSSSSDSDTDSEDDRRNDMARHTRGRRPSGEKEADPEVAGCCPEHDNGHQHQQKIKRRRRKPSPNAYEKMPKPSKGQRQGQGQVRGT